MERKPKSLAIHFGSRLARPSIQIFRIPRVWKRNNPTLPRKLVRAATSPGGDQRSFPQTPILASFLPSLSFHCTVVRMHHSIHVSFLRSVSSRPLVRYIYSLDRKLVVVANREGRDFPYAYSSINISPLLIHQSTM